MSKYQYVIAVLLLFLANLAWSQSEIAGFDHARVNSQKGGLMILGGWAVMNLISSPILTKQSTGSKRYFHQMNGYWNTVNLAIAGIGYLTLTTLETNSLSIANVLNEQVSIEKMLLFNAGLDIGYILGGFYLMEKSKNTSSNPERLKGFGQSIIFQGGFLFLFDTLFYITLHQNHLKILDWLSQSRLSISGQGLIYTF